MNLPKCFLCNNEMDYTYGECLVDSIYYCIKDNHPDYQVNQTLKRERVTLYLMKYGVSIQWIFIDDNYESVKILKFFTSDKIHGQGYKILPWFEPDFSDLEKLLSNFY